MGSKTPNHWFTRSLAVFGLCLAFSIGPYLLAVNSFISSYWAQASSDQKGWTIGLLWPMLFVLPVIPWFKIAVPVAVAFAVPKRGLQIAFLAGALLLTLAIDVTTAAPFADQQTDGEELSAIGTLSPMFFKFCIWAAAGLGAFVASRGLDRASNPEREV